MFEKMTHLEIGSTPYAEECVQVGSDNYYSKSRIECNAFIRQLKRNFTLPENAGFQIKSFPHDFGSYHEVVVKYPDSWNDCIDDNCDVNTCENCQKMKLIYDVESNVPEFWDNEAKKELQENNVTA
jgi:hypothetical protein